MLLPATASTTYPARSRLRSTPTWAQPLAPPAPNAIPTDARASRRPNRAGSTPGSTRSAPAGTPAPADPRRPACGRTGRGPGSGARRPTGTRTSTGPRRGVDRGEQLGQRAGAVEDRQGRGARRPGGRRRRTLALPPSRPDDERGHRGLRRRGPADQATAHDRGQVHQQLRVVRGSGRGSRRARARRRRSAPGRPGSPSAGPWSAARPRRPRRPRAGDRGPPRTRRRAPASRPRSTTYRQSLRSPARHSTSPAASSRRRSWVAQLGPGGVVEPVEELGAHAELLRARVRSVNIIRTSYTPSSSSVTRSCPGLPPEDLRASRRCSSARRR